MQEDRPTLVGSEAAPALTPATWLLEPAAVAAALSLLLLEGLESLGMGIRTPSGPCRYVRVVIVPFVRMFTVTCTYQPTMEVHSSHTFWHQWTQDMDLGNDIKVTPFIRSTQGIHKFRGAHSRCCCVLTKPEVMLLCSFQQGRHLL